MSGNEIWIKAGAHYPGAIGDSTAIFTLKNNVALYGGFGGSETARIQHNWRANVSILSGDIDRNDNHGGDYINENASQIVGDNAFHVVTASGTDATAGLANVSYYSYSMGGGMYNNGGSPTLTNVTFCGSAASVYGGGVYNGLCTLTLVNAILWDNSAVPYPCPQIYNHSSSTSLISYSDPQGCGGSGSWNSACGMDGGGNIDADPLFVDPASGNLSLQLTSPAIDAGNNAAVPAGITTDLNGNPRLMNIPTVPNTGNGTPPIVDMVAYEARPYTLFLPLVLRGAR